MRVLLLWLLPPLGEEVKHHWLVVGGADRAYAALVDMMEVVRDQEDAVDEGGLKHWAQNLLLSWLIGKWLLLSTPDKSVGPAGGMQVTKNISQAAISAKTGGESSGMVLFREVNSPGVLLAGGEPVPGLI
jgi:hypothetical protein